MPRAMNSTCLKTLMPKTFAATVSTLVSTVALALVLLAGLCVPFPVAAATVDLDRVVAVVNNSVITQFDLNKRVEQALRQIGGRNVQPPPRHQLEKQLLERMITERVLLQMAEDTNIRFDGPQVDRAMDRIAEKNKLSPEAFRKAVEADGIDFNDFREQIRTEMTIARLREREVDSRIVVTDAEIDNYLANPDQMSNQQDEFNLAHILILAPEGATPEKLAELKAKADKALAELKGGADFSQVSAAYSDAQNAIEGGGLGWRSMGQLPTLFTTVLKDMNPGDVSPVLRSANGFHIIKLLDKRGKNVQLIIKQTHARHILIKTNEVVSDEDAKNRLLQLKERIENGASFEELAKLHSDDLSASKGGDLGWLSPGDTVPEFERAMDGLKPNEVSEPVHTQFGWHLIQVLERRDQDVTQERKRLEARRAIRERKSDEAFDDWVRQARDRAYVEYRLEE